MRISPTDIAIPRSYGDGRNELNIHQSNDMLAVVRGVLWLNVVMTPAITATHS